MFFFLKLKKKLFLPPFLPAPYLWTEWDTYKTTTLLDSQANGIAWEISMNIVFCLNRTYTKGTSIKQVYLTYPTRFIF